jgi:hypothetical protein
VSDADLILKEFNGWPVGFRPGDTTPLVRDIDLGTRLRYPRPRKVRELIERMIAADQLVNVHVRPATGRTSMPKGGFREETGDEYWLTEAQALKVAARSETEIANELLDEMIAVYMAARRGELPGPTAPAPQQTPEALRRAELTAEALRGMGDHIAPAQKDAIRAHIVALCTGLDAKRLLPVQEERWKRPDEIAAELGVTRYEVSRALTALKLREKERSDMHRVVRDLKSHGHGTVDCLEYCEAAVAEIREWIAANPWTPKRPKKKAPTVQASLPTDPAPANDAPGKEDPTAA